MGFPAGASGKEPAYQCRSLNIPWVGKIPLVKGMATHSSILAWRMDMDREEALWDSL